MSFADDILRTVLRASDDALRDAALLVAEQAKRNMPVGDPAQDPNPGVTLAESVNIEKDGRGYVVSVDTPYAAKQHEAQSFEHPRGGGPKYLERAVTQIAPVLDGIVASKVRARTRRGV